jgi:hypothetical protein
MAEPGTRTARWVLCALLALGTVVWATSREDHHNPTADPHADAAYYYAYLPSLVLDHDLQFANQYQETKNWYRLGPTPTGRAGNVFGIGPAIFGLPVFIAAHAIAKATDERTDGFSRWETWSYSFASLAWSLGAVWLAFRLCRRRFGGGARNLVGPLVAALAGPVVYYAVRQPGYAHPVATFFATWFIERWDASYDRPRTLRTWLGLGALLGAAALARPQLALWGVLLARAALDDLDQRADLPGWGWRLPLRWLGAGALAALVFAPQLVAWKLLYGHYYVVPQGAGFMRWDDPCWSETLFSSRNGLFPWSPAYALCAIALIAGLRRMPRLAGALIAGVLLQALANGAVWDWWAGGSFGGRRFDSAYLAFAVGAQLLVALIGAALARVRLRGPHDARSLLAVGRGGAALGAIVIIGALVIANLQLAAATSVTSARITGGEAASVILARTGKGPIGTIAGWASALANWPARAAFAWRHDAPLGAYDRVVGVHVLGDTFPGLNSYKDERAGQIPVGDPGRPQFTGLGPGPRPNTAALTGERARILIVLNRVGRLDLRIGLEGAGQVTISWNGQIQLETAFVSGAVFTIRVDELRRGANDLVIEAPAGTVLRPIDLEASDLPNPPRI